MSYLALVIDVNLILFSSCVLQDVLKTNRTIKSFFSVVGCSKLA